MPATSRAEVQDLPVIAAAPAVTFADGWDLRVASLDDALITSAELRGDVDAPVQLAALPRQQFSNPKLIYFSIDSVLKQGGRAQAGTTPGGPPALRGGVMLNAIGRAAEFHTRAIEVSNTDGLEQWKAVLRRSTREEGDLTACAHAISRCANGALRHWHNIIESLNGADELAKLRIVNSMINGGWRYRTDMDVYGVPEYWATASEFIANGGDCEDFAIAKLWTLKIAGISEDRMRVVVVYDAQHRDYHAVLSVDIGGRAMVLDNQRQQVYDANEGPNYRALFSYAMHRGVAQAFAHKPDRLASR